MTSRDRRTRNYIVKNLKPKALMIVDDQEAYSTGLVSSMIPVFKAAGISVDHESVSQKVTDFSSLVARSTRTRRSWSCRGRSRLTASSSARTSPSRRRRRRSSGPTACSPRRSRSRARTSRRSDRTSTRSRRMRRSRPRPRRRIRSTGRSARPCTPATHVVDEAIASVCKSGQTPTRARTCWPRSRHRRAELDPWAADQVRQPRRSRRREVVPVQDQPAGQVRPGHEFVIG